MAKDDFWLKIRVKGRPIEMYQHEGKVFVEGRKGSDFDVEFTNRTKSRVLVVPSVDGLSPLDGEPAGPDSKGYIVAGGATLIIPGWTVNDESVARFLFENKEKSYGNHVEGSSVNAGVVGVLVYAEKTEPKSEVHHHHHHTTIHPPARILPIQPAPVWPQWPYQAPFYTGSPTCAAGKPQPLTASAVRSMRSATDIGQMSVGASATNASLSTRGIASQDALFGQASDTMARYSAGGDFEKVIASSEDESPFGLGTGWGKKTEFKINHTTFNRGDLKEQILLYYDTRRNLEKRGIQITPLRVTDEVLPQAFSGVGCKPPPGWTG